MFRSPRKTKLELEIETQLARLRENVNDPEEYDLILARIEKLHKVKDKPNSVPAETWALIGANLLGIVIIITHEYHHPITTKALNLAIKAGRART
jgi:hypothetical protein